MAPPPGEAPSAAALAARGARTMTPEEYDAAVDY